MIVLGIKNVDSSVLSWIEQTVLPLNKTRSGRKMFLTRANPATRLSSCSAPSQVLSLGWYSFITMSPEPYVYIRRASSNKSSLYEDYRDRHNRFPFSKILCEPLFIYVLTYLGRSDIAYSLVLELRMYNVYNHNAYIYIFAWLMLPLREWRTELLALLYYYVYTVQYINKRKDYLLGMFLHYTRVHCVATLCTTERRAKNRQLALAQF